MASITVRGRRYLVRVRVAGVSKSKSFKTKEEAKAWAQAEEAAARATVNKGPIGTGSVTVGAVIDRYVTEVKPLKPWGRSKDAALYTLRARLGKVKLSDLTAGKVLSYAEGRRRNGAKPQTIDPEISYLGQVLRVAHAVWRYDFDKDVVSEARVALRLMGMTGRSHQRDRRPTDTELGKLRAYFRDDYRSAMPMHDIIDFAVETGMRMSEIVGLEWRDYDEKGRTILVRNRKHPQEKIGNNMRVPLLGEAQAILLRQPQDGPRPFPYTTTAVSAAFTRACKRLDIDDLHFHDLRHEFCSRMFERGYSIPEVALCSGHRDWGQLKRYTQIRAESLHR